MSKLFSSYRVKNLEIKNRIVMAPMCMYSADSEGNPGTWHYLHYGNRAIVDAKIETYPGYQVKFAETIK